MKTKVIGPPGCGKTTYLIGKVGEYINSGLHPMEIVYTTFTKAGAREAMRRALIEFPHYSEEDFPHFATTHSIAFHILGIGGKVFTDTKLKEFGDKYGHNFSARSSAFDSVMTETMLSEKGDYLEFFDCWRKNCLYEDIQEAFEDFTEANQRNLPHWWSLAVVESYIEGKNEFKREEGLFDFSDFLLGCLERQLCPPGMKVLLVDECQDNNQLMQKVHQLWAEAAEDAYVVGDPNQAIFEFQGSNPALFIDMAADRTENLRQSWRCSKAVHELARKVITRNSIRMIDDDFTPTEAAGVVERIDVKDIDWGELIKDGATLFYLLRTRWLVTQAYDRLMTAGVPFVSSRGLESPLGHLDMEGRFIQAALARSAVTMLTLSDARPVMLSSLADLTKHIPAKPYMKHGSKAELQRRAKDNPGKEVGITALPELGFTPRFLEYLNESDFTHPLKGTPEEKDYLLRVYGRYGEGAFHGRPPIALGTMHSSKGAEADTVVIDPTYTRLPWESMNTLEGREAENRLAYVSVTRAREKVIILEPQWDKAYEY